MYRLGSALHDRLVRWLGHGIALIGLTFFVILILGKDGWLRSVPLALIAMFLSIGFLWVQDGRQPLAISGIDWTQGLIRLWVVATLIWAGLVLYIQVPEHAFGNPWLDSATAHRRLDGWTNSRWILEGFRNES
jgi:hypothetical protein